MCRTSGKPISRKPSFRCMGFSEIRRLYRSKKAVRQASEHYSSLPWPQGVCEVLLAHPYTLAVPFLPLTAFFAHHQNRAMCVPNHQLRDTTHQRSAYTAQAPAAQDDEACSQLLG